ncbi:MAG: type III-A CRISPR-associated RAMP protein Csm3 [Sphingomonadaceae bacterium]|uniref:type III-A CRISPR-associated RAMP protein Csm3 n=1 Tax=Thermaurantiacus sp. TaxID=2820283 RepID=UPI00298F23C7|nr:type III-A CRISPR-associated RAMP protein Csm3 [Thermaurantiacus sp.]MCS6987686.1 type III-A CRISPR-associated RAMP protein Csm3 [Sphingomonadaceae bacterium]MDW8415910.1 type III-A CRISPR-associated RAMP protein Csm3 [Thermaurantiacus sp.]
MTDTNPHGKLVAIRRIEAELEVVTGLHIGAGDLEMRIGGIDRPVIRDPVTELPYVPGSSLKGRMRALLEWTTGALVGDSPLGLRQAGQPGVREILLLFGLGGGDADPGFGPSRLSVADAFLVDACRPDRGRNAPLTEAKFENQIHRISGTAIHPRQTERVVPGVRFRFDARLRRFENDPDLMPLLFRGMALVELDALGGSGSRGYGKVRFENVTVDGKACPEWRPADPFQLAA